MTQEMHKGGGRTGAVNTTQGVNTGDITGGKVSTFSPLQKEQEDSQEEFQTGSGVLIGWRRKCCWDRLVTDPKKKTGETLCLCESINISLNLPSNISSHHLFRHGRGESERENHNKENKRWGNQTDTSTEIKRRVKREWALGERRGFLTVSHSLKVSDMDRTWRRLLCLGCWSSVGLSGRRVFIFFPSCWFRGALVGLQSGWRGRRVRFVYSEGKKKSVWSDQLISSVCINILKHVCLKK